VVVSNVDPAPTAIAGGNLTANEAASVTLTARPAAIRIATRSLICGCRSPDRLLPEYGLPVFYRAIHQCRGRDAEVRANRDGFSGTSSDTATLTVSNINGPRSVGTAQTSLGTLWPPIHKLEAISLTGIQTTTLR